MNTTVALVCTIGIAVTVAAAIATDHFLWQMLRIALS